MTDETTTQENGGILRKITTATIVGKIDRPAKGDKVKPLYRVYGMATGVKTGSTQFGDWTGLTGQFEAVNLETGEISVSPVCILPEPMNSLLFSRVQAGESVQFAYEIGVEHSEKGSTGYAYTTKPIVKETQNDPLAELRAAVKALPAPTAGTAVATRKK